MKRLIDESHEAVLESTEANLKVGFCDDANVATEQGEEFDVCACAEDETSSVGENGDKKPVDSRKLLYGFDEKPKSKWELFFLAFQQASVAYIGMLVVPFMLGGTLGLDGFGVATIISGCAIATGIASLFQIYFGSRLPILEGPAFGFALVAVTIFTMFDGTPAEKMSTYCTALITGGIFDAIIGYSGLIGKLRKFFTPNVTGTSITLIGLSLVSWATNTAGTNWIMAAIMVSLVLILNYYCGMRVGAFSALIAIVIGYLVCLIGTMTGLISEGSALYVDFSAVHQSPWVAFPKPFPWGPPKWSLAAFLVMLAPLFAGTVESIGDYLAVAQGANLPNPTTKQYNHGIGAEGLGIVVSGIFGGSGVTSYSQNTSLMILTKVASKAVYTLAACIVIALSFVPKVSTIFSTLPAPVIGGVYFATFGLILSIGIKIIGQGVDLNKDRNLSVVGLSIFLGLALPYYMRSHPIVIESATWLADILNAFLGTEMIIGSIFAIFFDRILPNRDEYVL